MKKFIKVLAVVFVLGFAVSTPALASYWGASSNGCHPTNGC